MKPETLAALHDGLWMVVNARGHRRPRAHRRARRRRQDRHGAGDLADGRARRAARQDGRARPRLVRVLRAARQPARSPASIFAEHAEHGYLGAPIAKYVDRDLLRQEGRQAAADAAAGEQPPAGRRSGRHADPAAGRDRTASATETTRPMFERRLYFHVDWLLLGAILVLTGIGVAMIYSTTYVHAARAAGTPGRSSAPRSTRSASASSRLSCACRSTTACWPRTRCSSTPGCCALLLYVLIKGSTRRAARSAGSRSGRSTSSRRSSARVDAGADARDVLRREPARRAQPRRPHDRRPVHGRAVLLIARQPDLGTAVTLIPVCFGIAYLAGRDGPSCGPSSAPSGG